MNSHVRVCVCVLSYSKIANDNFNRKSRNNFNRKSILKSIEESVLKSIEKSCNRPGIPNNKINRKKSQKSIEADRTTQCLSIENLENQ